MDRNLALEAVRVTEAAALAASLLMGRGDEKAADQAAVDAMRRALNGLAIDGTVVIGEGERDEAPMLYIGEKVGTGQGPQDRHRARSARRHHPDREGRRQRAGGAGDGGMPRGSCNAPDVYMDKIAIGGGLGDIVDLDETPATNLKALAKAKKARGRRPRRLHPRPAAPCRADRQGARGRRAHHADHRRRCQRRHRHRRGARPASISTWARAARPRACWPRRRCAASAATCRAGCCSATTTSAAARAKLGITDLNRKYGLHDLAKGNVMFAATGVTAGSMLAGVRRFPAAPPRIRS